jgi:hypothetical protein
MFNRYERRKASTFSKKKFKMLKTATLDHHLDDMLRRVRVEFERTGEVHSRFECVTDGEIFHVPASWRDHSEKAAVCAALRDSFRRRRVNRYVFASEGWVGKTPGLPPRDDPDRGECVQVIAVERNGPRRYAVAEITRSRETATFGPWQVNSEAPQSWLVELLEDGYTDRSPGAEPPPLGRISKPDLPKHRVSYEILSQFGELIADQVQKHGNGDPAAMFMALESVLLSMIKDMGSPKGIGEFARFLRDHPDKFPMFSTVPGQVPSTLDVRRCKTTLRSFICEKLEAAGHAAAMFEVFMNMYMRLGSQAIGALNLADRIENWDPEHQAKLRQLGLRSSFELDDEEGHVFLALSADRYPIGVMGRRNAVGDLFVSRIVSCRTAISSRPSTKSNRAVAS